MVHDPVAEVGREDLARLGTVGHEADRATGLVGVVTQLTLEGEQLGFGVVLEVELVDRVALVPAAGTVLPP